MSEPFDYAPIPAAAVRALVEEDAADFDVFLPGPAGQGPVLYRASGVGLSQPDFERMRAHGVNGLYISSKDYPRCEATLEAKLGAIITNPNVSPDDKAKVVHRVGTSVARDLMGNPSEPLQIERTSAVVDCMINSVLNDPIIASTLLEMAGHERSTASHMFIVATLAVMLGAEVFESDVDTLKDLSFAGMLHDVGMLSIDRGLLNKTTPLTREELEIVHQHPIESVRLIGDNPEVSLAVRQMVLQHHERIDGRGYPLGLSGLDLLPGSRLLSIVDSFHAMIGYRSYRQPLTPAEANRALATQAGRQFDEDMLDCWISLFERSWSKAAAGDACEGLTEPDELSSRHEHRPTLSAPTDIIQRQPRFACHGKATVQCIYAGRLSDATEAPGGFVAPAKDVSRGGICILNSHPMYRGETLYVRIQAQGGYVWLHGTVAWCRQDDTNRYRVGVQFVQRVEESQVAEYREVTALTELQNSLGRSVYGTSNRAESDSAAEKTTAEVSGRAVKDALETLTLITAAERISAEDQATAIRFSASRSAEVRLRAIDALACIGTYAASDALIALIRDVEPEIREKAAATLGAKRAPEAVGPLRKLLEDPVPSVALRAAGALGRLQDTSGLQLVASTLESDSPETRIAVQAFGEITGHRFSTNQEGVEAARRYLAATKSLLGIAD
ncbi:MAG: HEAT repeat domain-containing protein [Phycisphaerales bacterium]|nr:MAG: HEAT repeat domain-containing protein [Phycisphaerales bacterium]